MRSLSTILITAVFILLQSCNNKEPYQLPVYHAKGFVISQEKCSVDSNYNYSLLDLSIKNTSAETGDSITYKGVKYYHVFKTLSTSNTLHKPGNKVEFDYTFLNNDHAKTQSTSCDAPDAETFLLIDINLLNVKEIN